MAMVTYFFYGRIHNNCLYYSENHNMAARFIIIGATIAMAIWLLERKSWSWRLRIPLLLVAVIVCGLATYLMMDKHYLGDTDWYNRFPYRELTLFIGMLFGMIARTISQSVEVRRKKIRQLRDQSDSFQKPPLEVDFWEFSYPLLFSAITFGALLGQVGESKLTLIVLVTAFETGFFWQTLLKKD